MRQLPSLKALRAFEAVARHESVTLASREFNVSHSAISQQVKALEAYFNQKLFTKKGNGLELTPKARAFLQDIRQGFDILELASANLANPNALKRVKVNATPSFSARWLLPRIADFHRSHPDIEIGVETSSTDDTEDVSRHCDLIIRRYRMNRAGMQCDYILDDSAVAVMSPQLFRDTGIKEPMDLMKLSLLHVKTRISVWPKWFRKAGFTSNETLRGPVFDHFFLSIIAAQTGAGVALAPLALVKDDIEAGNLVTAFPEVCVNGPGFHALSKNGSRNERNVRLFLDWLTSESVSNGSPSVDAEWNALPD